MEDARQIAYGRFAKGEINATQLDEILAKLPPGSEAIAASPPASAQPNTAPTQTNQRFWGSKRFYLICGSIMLFSFVYIANFKDKMMGGLSINNLQSEGPVLSMRLMNDSARSGPVVIDVKLDSGITQCTVITNIQQNRTNDLRFRCGSSLAVGQKFRVSTRWADEQDLRAFPRIQ